MKTYKIKRDPDGLLTENCPVVQGVAIGSFDCTANCKNNRTPKNEIHKHGFDLPHLICDESEKLPQNNQQLTIEI